jgi:hypothetical protein
VAWLRDQVARFSRGDVHAARRVLVTEFLAAIDFDALRHSALTDPVEVLATALGVPGVAADVREVARVYLPPAEPDAAADAAVARLVAAFGGRFDVETANRIGLLAQACAATTTLIERAARLDSGSAPQRVARVLRDDQPAVATRRTAVEPTGAVAAGEMVTVSLTSVPFGAGPHACPGREHAIAIACAVLEASHDRVQ